MFRVLIFAKKYRWFVEKALEESQKLTEFLFYAKAKDDLQVEG